MLKADFFVVVGLPIFLVYILFFVRYIERRIYLREHPDSSFLLTMPLLSLRDAALVTLALDLSELFQAFRLPFEGFLQTSPTYRVHVLIFLFFFHILTLFIGLYSERRIGRIEYLKRSAWFKLMHMYMALAVLLTNAVTIQHLLVVVGGIK